VIRAVLIALAAAGALLAAAPAWAQPAGDDDDVPVTRMRFIERGPNLTVTTSIGKLFDSEGYEALESGLPATVVVRLWIFRPGRSEPVAFQLLQRRIVYDLWDEVYQVRLDGPGGRRTMKVKFRAEALRLVTSLDAVPIAALADLPAGDVFSLALVAELNPVAAETLAEVRRWLSQGGGGGLDRGGSFFGSFVSVFVNPKLAEADRVLRLRSQPFFRPRT
jgi:hypothetical protein